MKLPNFLKESRKKSHFDLHLAANFITNLKQSERFAVGKNSESLALNGVAPLAAIVDDYATPGSKWNGIPLISITDLPKDSTVVNCSSSIRPVDVLAALKAFGIKRIIGINDVIEAAEGRLSWPRFVTSFREEMASNRDAWQEIFDALEDEESKTTLIDICMFRNTADIHYMRDYKVRLDQQYFEDFMSYEKEVFVDAGGFDGDTSEVFAARYQDYKQILFFEPSQKNMDAARRRLSNIRGIEYYPIGLSDVRGNLTFDEGAGSASSVTDFGNSVIAVDTLDSAVQVPVSFIKMDLEGWELRALRGAVRHIRQERPKLAIAVYHDSADFRSVFQFVRDTRPDYKVYLRHYTQGWSETVMYFK